MRLVCMDKVTKAYIGRTILDKYSLNIDSHSRTALTGISGIGKTTLLNLILGLAVPDAGTVTLADELKPCVVFQENRLLEQFCAMDNLDVYPLPFLRSAAAKLLTAFGLDSLDISDTPGKTMLYRQPVQSFSGGMKRRVAIARALYGCILYSSSPSCGEKVLLIMDEPFKGLDAELKIKVMDTVDHVLKSTNASLLMVTHEPEEAAALGCSFINL